MQRKYNRVVVALLTLACALLALNLFRAAEPQAQAQPGMLNVYNAISADGTSAILFRLTSSGRIEAYDTLNLLGRPDFRWTGWKPVN